MSETEMVVRPCPSCKRPLNFPIGKKLHATCVRLDCRAEFDIDTTPKRSVPWIVTGAVAGSWCLVMTLFIASTGGAQAAAIVSGLFWFIANKSANHWSTPNYDNAPLFAARRLLKYMTFTAIPFAMMAIYLELGLGGWLGRMLIEDLLLLQIGLAKYGLADQIGAIAGSLALGLTMFGLAFWLNDDTAAWKWIKRLKDRTGRYLGAVTAVLLCFSSFSIVATASGTSMIHLTEHQIVHQLKAVKDNLSLLEHGLRISFGEYLAARAFNLNPSPSEFIPPEGDFSLCSDSSVTDASCGPVLLSQQIVNRDGVLTSNFPYRAFQPVLDTLYKTASQAQAARENAGQRRNPASYAKYTPNDIEAAVDAFCKTSRCKAPYLQPGLRDIAAELLSLREVANLPLPKFDISTSAGKMFDTFVKTFTTKPLGDMKERWINEGVDWVLSKCMKGQCPGKPAAPSGMDAEISKVRPQVDELTKSLAIRLEAIAPTPKPITPASRPEPDGDPITEPSGGNPDSGDCYCGRRRVLKDVTAAQCLSYICGRL